MSNYRIALVEDDDQLRENYSRALEREGYEVKAYSNRTFAAAAFRKRLPDLAILDVMLGDDMEGGFELCQQLRSMSPTTPIIFLTARNSDVDRVSGLRLGAWDYLTKDTTTLDFLPARVSALFRIVESLKTKPADEELIKAGSLVIDKERQKVSWKEDSISLTYTEFMILLSLVINPGHRKSHDQLKGAADLGYVNNNTVAQHIGRIRTKFRAADPDFNAICSDYGTGYYWQVG